MKFFLKNGKKFLRISHLFQNFQFWKVENLEIFIENFWFFWTIFSRRTKVQRLLWAISYENGDFKAKGLVPLWNFDWFVIQEHARFQH